MHKLLQQQKGFSFIELLIVIAILGIIATVVILNIPTFYHTQSNNETVNRIVIGQLTAIDSQGEWAYLYFLEGPKVRVTTESLASVTNNTDPFNKIWTYRLDNNILVEIIPTEANSEDNQ
jgi:prepilin-type N-terminal cleavage/methylation domain-containing protein